MRNTEPPSQKLQILQIPQNYPNEIKKPHRRNHRYRRYCKYRKIIQMRITEPPSQKSQILQISPNYPNESYRTTITEIPDIANIAELSKWDTESPSQNSHILQISQNCANLWDAEVNIQNPHHRNHKYCRITQMRDTEPHCKKSQISQNYPNERYRIPITEITNIANIAELCKWEIQNPHCRNRR